MNQSSAKCNSNLSEDIQQLLEESDSEYANEEATCNFIKEAVLGNIDENGFVLTSSSSKNTFWNSGPSVGSTNSVPIYGSSNAVTGGQAVALTLSILGTATLGYVAYFMRQQVESKEKRESLMPQKEKQII